MPTVTFSQRAPWPVWSEGGWGVGPFTYEQWVKSVTYPQRVQRRKPRPGIELLFNITALDHRILEKHNGLYTLNSGKAVGPVGSIGEAWTHVGEKSYYNSHVVGMTNALLASVADSGFNAGQFAAELGKTSRSFLKLAQQCRAYYQAARKLKLKGLKIQFGREKPTASGAWLQYQYGIKPAVMDLHNGMTALMDAAQRINLETRNSSRPVTEHSVTSSQKDGHPVVTSVSRSDIITVQAYYQLDPKGVLTILNRYGLQNPLSLGWELVPFSFVVDWSFDVGTMLRAVEASALIKRSSGFYTVQTNTSKTTLYKDGTATVTYRRYMRSPLSVGTPSFPRFNTGASKTHLLNGLALLDQCRRRL